MFAVNGDFVMRPDVTTVAMPAAEYSMCVFVIAVLVISGYIANQIGLSQRKAIRSVELQAWHLRQLVKE
jgi:hypothetical protein